MAVASGTPALIAFWYIERTDIVGSWLTATSAADCTVARISSVSKATVLIGVSSVFTAGAPCSIIFWRSLICICIRSADTGAGGSTNGFGGATTSTGFVSKIGGVTTFSASGVIFGSRLLFAPFLISGSRTSDNNLGLSKPATWMSSVCASTSLGITAFRLVSSLGVGAMAFTSPSGRISFRRSLIGLIAITYSPLALLLLQLLRRQRLSTY